MLDQTDHGHHVLRAYSKNVFVKRYEKDNTFLRIETCSNNLKDFRQKKALEHLPEVAEKLQAVNERFADAQAENLNVEVDYPLLEKLAKPCRLKSRRMAGIRLENDRIIRLLEVLMHSSSHLGGHSAAEIHQAVLQAYQLSPEQPILLGSNHGKDLQHRRLSSAVPPGTSLTFRLLTIGVEPR